MLLLVDFFVLIKCSEPLTFALQPEVNEYL